MENINKQLVGMSIIVLTLMICSCFFVTAGFVDGLPGTSTSSTSTSTSSSGGSTSSGSAAVTTTDDNETATDDDGDADSTAEDAGVVDKIIEDVRDSRLGAWISIVAVIIIIAGIVFWKRKGS